MTTDAAGGDGWPWDLPNWYYDAYPSVDTLELEYNRLHDNCLSVRNIIAMIDMTLACLVCATAIAVFVMATCVRKRKEVFIVLTPVLYMIQSFALIVFDAGQI